MLVRTDRDRPESAPLPVPAIAALHARKELWLRVNQRETLRGIEGMPLPLEHLSKLLSEALGRRGS